MKITRRDFVASLESGLAVIEAFDAAHPRLTLTEVAGRTGLTRAAARRYLLTLAELGYADYDGKHFSLTLRVLRLGYGHLSTAPLPRKAQPLLEAIGQQTGEAASVAVLDDTEVVFLARSDSRRLVSVRVGVGTRLPVYCTSTGRVLLSACNDSEGERLLSRIEPIPFTPKTKTTKAAILDSVREARAAGYALSDEEYEVGLRSVAVPVRAAQGQVVAALTVSVQSARMAPAQMVRELLPPLHDAARSLAALL